MGLDFSRSRHHPQPMGMVVTEQAPDPSRPERGFSYSEAIERILALEGRVSHLEALAGCRRGPAPIGSNVATCGRDPTGPESEQESSHSSGRTRDVASAPPCVLRVEIARKIAPVPPVRGDAVAWSGADRAPCPRGCGSLVRRDNLSRHLKRCVGPPGTSEEPSRPDE
jgi:hypothetical protein